MIAILVAAFFCVLNICLWCVFFIKFQKLFSTKDIVNATREQIESLISDLNNNTARDISLIEDRIKQLKAATAEADRHVEVAQRELEAQKEKLFYQQKINSTIQAVPNSSSVRNAALRYEKQKTNKPYLDISTGLIAENSYEVVKNPQNHPPADLFEQADADDKRKIVSPTGTVFTVESDGSSYTQVPVLGGNVSYADEPISPQKTFSQQVHDLTLAGWSVDEIARELNRSTTEVQFALNMDSGL